MHQQYWARVDGETDVMGDLNQVSGVPLSYSASSLTGGYISTDDAGNIIVSPHGTITYNRRDGTSVEYVANFDGDTGCFWSQQIYKITRPDGETLTYYESGINSMQSTVVSNLGYQIRIFYEPYNINKECVGAEKKDYDSSYKCITSVTLVDTSVDDCAPLGSCVYTRDWPTLRMHSSGPNILQISDVLGRTTVYHSTSYQAGSGSIKKLFTKVVRPEGRTTNISYVTSVSPSVTITGQVGSITNGNSTWTYAVDSEPLSGSGNRIIRSAVSVTDPLGGVTRYANSSHFGPAYGEGRAMLESVRDPAGRVTSYSWYGYHMPRLRRVTYPSGGYVHYDYDNLQNLTSISKHSSESDSPRVVLFGYKSACEYNILCYKPIYRDDELGNRTNFAYDPVHGGVVSIEKPSDGGVIGQRAKTIFEYDAGVIGVARLLRVRNCTIEPNCAEGGAEAVVETVYDAKRRPIITSHRAGDWAPTTSTTADARSMVTRLTYNYAGDTSSTDGPLPGNVDTAYYYYDAARQLVMWVSGAPSTGGGRSIVRYVYDYEGRQIRIDTGVGTNVDGSDLVVNNFKRMAYNSDNGLLAKVEEVVP
ncbi:hypothetical protein ACIQTU_15595 [Brevundimonas sp. NPDC090276]|uniref:hypothetical protein n=1 Tax=Brevundimonas sp. NPDC090276 TaxID=3363956 RepID=UPI00383B1F3A